MSVKEPFVMVLKTFEFVVDALTAMSDAALLWFEDEDENALTITKNRYLAALKRMITFMRDRGLGITTGRCKLPHSSQRHCLSGDSFWGASHLQDNC